MVGSMVSTVVQASLVVSLILIAPADVVFAQAASITGVVRDGINRVIPGVTIIAVPESGGLSRHTTSGSDGAYRFEGLPDGTYRVDFELRGFDVVRRNHVRVRGGAEARADAALPVRVLCECITAEPQSPWAQRAGQVIDKAGYPLPHARIELVGREAMYADSEGRFLIRLAVKETWPLKATDTGFGAVTQEVSGADAASVVISLEYGDAAGVADLERFGGCECHGYLFPYGAR